MREMSETKTIRVQDIDFTIGFISRKIWRRIASRISEPMEIVNQYKKDMKVDSKFVKASEELQDAYWDMLKYGIKNHKGFKRQDGTEILFHKDSEGFVHPELLETYDLNTLLIPLGVEIMMFNVLSETERKN